MFKNGYLFSTLSLLIIMLSSISCQFNDVTKCLDGDARRCASFYSSDPTLCNKDIYVENGVLFSWFCRKTCGKCLPDNKPDYINVN
jgi:hypothetical protein